MLQNSTRNAMSSVFGLGLRVISIENSADSAERRRRYAALLEQGVTDEDAENIRRCPRKGLPAGSEHFREQIEKAPGGAAG